MKLNAMQNNSQEYVQYKKYHNLQCKLYDIHDMIR